MSEESIENPIEKINDKTLEPKKRGRKMKYFTEEERNEARRKQQKEYRVKKHLELIELRRKAAELKSLDNVSQ